MGERAVARRRRGCALDLHVTYADGSEDVIASDDSWKASTDGPTRTTTTTSARPTTRDARSPGGSEPGFSDAAWAARARRRARRQGRCAHRRTSRFASSPCVSPARAREPSPGVFVYDTGQNLTGWVEIARRGAGRHRHRGVLLREAGERRDRARRRQRSRRSASCRPTTTSRRGVGPRAVVAALHLQGLPVRPAQRRRTAQPLPARRHVSRRACRAGAIGSADDVDASRRDQPTLDTHPSQHVRGRSRTTCTASSPTRRSTRRTRGPATRSSRRRRASLLFDTERLYRKMFQDMRDAQTRRRARCRCSRRATRTTATSASRRSSRSTAAAPRPHGTRSGS